MQHVSPLQSTSTGILELAGFPHVYFNFVYFFLKLEEEVRGLTVARHLSSEGQVTDVLECRLELVKVISAELETPKIVLGVLWVLSLIMVRDCVQWSSILGVISRNDANDMRIWPHDHPSVTCRNAPPPVVSDDAGHIVDPAIEIKA